MKHDLVFTNSLKCFKQGILWVVLNRSLSHCGHLSIFFVLVQSYHFQRPQHDTTQSILVCVIGFGTKRVRIVKWQELVITALERIRRLGGRVPVGSPSRRVLGDTFLYDRAPFVLTRVRRRGVWTRIRRLGVILVPLDLTRLVQLDVRARAGRDRL